MIRLLHIKLTALLIGMLGWICLGTFAAAADQSVAVNESFESSSGALPSGWRFVQFKSDASTATVISGDAQNGTHYLRINSPQDNHARVILDVPVEAGQTYRFAAFARANGVSTSQTGAVLGVDSQFGVTNPGVTGTQWQELDLYVKTGQKTNVSLTMGLGNFGAMAHGTVDFDSVTVAVVASVPSGAMVVDFVPTPQASTRTADDVSLGTGPNNRMWVFVGFLALGVVGVAGYLTLSPGNRQKEAESAEPLTEADQPGPDQPGPDQPGPDQPGPDQPIGVEHAAERDD